MSNLESGFDPFRPVEKDSGRRWTPVIVLALGVLSIVVVLWIYRGSDRAVTQTILIDDTLRELQVSVATSHLWLEELLEGDESIDVDEVWADLERAASLALLMLRGGRVEEGGGVLLPLEEAELRRQAEALRGQLDTLKTVSRQRYEQGEGIGSDMDQSFDATFLGVLRDAETLRRDLSERSDRRRAGSHMLMRWVVFGWAFVVLFAVAALWSRERRRQQAELGLRASQQWLSTTLLSLWEGILVADLEGRILYANPVARMLTGWADDRAVGEPLDVVYRTFEDDESGGPRETPVSRLRRGEEVRPSAGNAILVALDGRRRHVEDTWALIREGTGEPLGIVLVFRDTSERHEAEARLREREDELRQAQRLETVGRLAGGIAHDINNYLGALKGHCEVAKLKQEHGEALSVRMDKAMEIATKASSLIRQLLAFSRRQPIRPEVVDLDQVVQRMGSMMRRLIGDDIVLAVDPSTDLWPVVLDPSQVEQVLVNLVVNSRDAMPRGGRIRVSTANISLPEDGSDTSAVLPPGRYVKLSVQDNGEGMPPAIREQIFEPYFTTKETIGSSGLGLATVYGIVRQNRGSIACASVEGEGTTFTILLPVAEGSPSVTAQDRVETPTGRRGAETILLVEDNDDMRSATAELLEALGHRVLTAAHGAEALATMESSSAVDLLVSDVVMPGMSGPELLDVVRERWPRIRCLFISGYTDNVMLRHGLSRGEVDFLPKPFDAPTLIAKISEILDDGGGEPGARRPRRAGA